MIFMGSGPPIIFNEKTKTKIIKNVLKNGYYAWNACFYYKMRTIKYLSMA